MTQALPRYAGTPFDLTGRTVLVTGGGTGIGAAVCRICAEAGAAVMIHCHRSREAADQLALELREFGQEVRVQAADLTDDTQASGLVDQTVQQLGRLDVLFNNAGDVLERSTLEHCSTELWQRSFDLNVHAAFYVTRRAIPHLRASGRGSIINNLSLSVQTGGSGGAGAYAAAKGALQVMTRTLARELAPQVRANAIMPGVVETPHHARFTSAEKMADYRRQTPLGRNAQPPEIASAVLFLASDASAFMTGAVLDLNGGRFLR